MVCKKINKARGDHLPVPVEVARMGREVLKLHPRLDHGDI